MALTRKLLESMGLDETKIDTIINAHAETVNGLKTERDEVKSKLLASEQVTAERDKLKAQVESLTKSGSDAAKIQKDFDDYKASVEAEKVLSGKRNAVSTMLKNAGVSKSDFIEFLAGKIDIEKVEMENGAVKGADELLKPLKEGYGSFFGKVQDIGTASITVPNAGGHGGVTKDAFEKMTLSEQCIFANEHPEEYRSFYK